MSKVVLVPRRVASLTTAPGPSNISSSRPVASRPLSSTTRRVSINLTQTFVDVTESTDNTDYILSAVQRKWGAQFVIVISNGLQIEDGSGTQGMINVSIVLQKNTGGCI